MQLTILSTKLPEQTDGQFEHEFRFVHAAATREMASTLGIIARYVQGIFIKSSSEKQLQNLPLPVGNPDLHSFAQLTWPSTTVLRGSLTTSGYRNSAGKHIFAKPAQIFITETLEIKESGVKKTEEPEFVLLVVLVPSSLDAGEFRTAWDSHAAAVRRKSANYQRNLSMSHSRKDVEDILGDSQFRPELCQLQGGYEEFGFSSIEDAQLFLRENGEGLKRSYGSFCGDGSYCMIMDHVVQYGEKDIGIRQRLAGIAVSCLMYAKVFFGI